MRTIEPDTTMHSFDPEAVLLPGRIDPIGLLVVWLIRKSFLPLLWLGFIGAALAGRLDSTDPSSFDSISEAWRALLSPLAGLILAFGSRLVAAGLGLLLAFRVVRAEATSSILIPRRKGSRVDVAERWRVTAAVRELRWTRVVRQAAVERLGTTGQRLVWIERAMAVAGWVLFVAMWIVLVAVSA